MLNAAPLQISAMTYNTRLWGETVFVRNRPTSVYCDDHRRAALMQERFQHLTGTGRMPDFVGLTEFWDQNLMATFLDSGLWNGYQWIAGPFAGGFPEIFPVMRQKSPFIHSLVSLNPDAVVKKFARAQLLEGAEAVHRDNSLVNRLVLNPIKERLIHMMGDLSFLGSGLVFLSRYRILEWSFVPFNSEKYGLDNYARKGVLCVNVELPDERRLSIMLTHLHVGKSEEEKAARHKQLRQLGPLVRSAPYPVLFLSDVNIIAEVKDASTGNLSPTDEYRRAIDELGLFDTFRDAHPDANGGFESGGFTYDDATHFSKALGIASTPDAPLRMQRIDVILRDPRLKTVSSRVFREQLRHEAYDNRYLSDHFALESTVAV